MDEINEIAADRHLTVVEDAAQALGSTYRGRSAGTLGSLAAFSFHETKNVISGEGGALTINNPHLVELAEIIREKGTNRARFFRGEVDKYTWMGIGSSYLPSELIAAFLYAQLESEAEIRRRRMAIWHRYDALLRPLAARTGLQVPHVPDDREHNGHLYYVIFETPERQRNFRAYMSDHGIMTPFHYVPLHTAPAGRELGRPSGNLSVTESVADRLVRLPIYLMDDDEQDYVMNVLARFFDGPAEQRGANAAERLEPPART